MSNLRQIIAWFLVCLILGIYAKSAGYIPSAIGKASTGAVLGGQKTAGFGH